jgi:hypothetical protein
LPEPEAATGEYKESMSPVAAWIDDDCVLEANAWTAGSALRESFARYCNEAGQRKLSPAELASALAAVGVHHERTGKGRQRGWRGIRLRGSLIHPDGGHERTVKSTKPSYETDLGEVTDSGVRPRPPVRPERDSDSNEVIACPGCDQPLPADRRPLFCLACNWRDEADKGSGSKPEAAE